MSFPARAPLLPGLPLMAPAPGYAMPAMMQHIPLHPVHGHPVHPHPVHGHPMHPHPVMFAATQPIPPQPTVAMTAPRHTSAKPTQQQYTYSRRTKEPAGPPVTVFIGNITERAPDGMMRLIINSCGTVLNWKRVQGASGRLQAFGFCEFGNPDAALRAIRLLHDLEMADKKLVAKVDSKSQEILDKFKEEKRTELNIATGDDKKSTAYGLHPSSPGSAAAAAGDDDTSSADTPAAGDNDYMSGDMREDDREALKRIRQLLEDYAQDMNSFAAKAKRDTRKKPEEKLSNDPCRTQNHSDSRMSVNLDGIGDLGDDKKDLITREIGLFRDKMKRQEEEKERNLGDRSRSPSLSTFPKGGATGGSRSSRSTQSSSRRRQVRTSRSRSRDLSLSPSRGAGVGSDGGERRSRSPSSPRAYAGESRHSHRSRRREKSHDLDRPSVRKTEAELLREREQADEAKERKKIERKAREKEAAYQERLRTWEAREVKRRKERTKESERQRQRDHDRVREAKKLKEFLEDYDDEKDDLKYYKGRELQRRLSARALESDQDSRDLQKEKEELEELRARIQEEGHKHPQMEFERLRLEREAQYQPCLLVELDAPRVDEGASTTVNNTSSTSAAMSAKGTTAAPSSDSGEKRSRNHQSQVFTIDEDSRSPQQQQQPPPTTVSVVSGGGTAVVDVEEDQSVTAVKSRSNSQTNYDSPYDGDTVGFGGDDDCASQDSTSQHAADTLSNQSAEPQPQQQQQTKPDSAAANNKNSNGSSAASVPAMKLVKKKLNVKDVFNTEDDEDEDRKKRRKLVPIDHDDDTKRKEDKKRLVKKLIDRIPTGKTELFSYVIDWDVVDNALMERRIRPWIGKKIAEYIGEPEPTLVEFICSKVLVGSTPQAILDDVQMVLDDEADVFVVKMWRLLIYEIEAKKHGLCK